MKKLLLGFLVVLLLCLGACAGLPPPEEGESSLVIGSLVLDFPDGFYALKPCCFTRGVKLKILNATSGKRFSLTTNDGYFYFLSNGTDEYVLESYEYTKRTDKGESMVGSNVGQKFTPVPNSLVYVGHITITYAAPEKVDKDKLGRKTTTYWNYKISAGVDYDSDTLMEYIEETDPGSAWLSYELVTLKS
jgi:hypothetical protein